VIDAVVATVLGQVILGIMALSCAMSATLMLVGGAVIACQQSRRLLGWLTR
jgi:hypothetical protein